MFENAKIGDKVWSIIYGEGNIVQIDDTEQYSLEVGYPGNNSYVVARYKYDIHGMKSGFDINPEIYPYPVEIVRKKEKIKRYRVLFSANGGLSISSNFHTDEKEWRAYFPDRCGTLSHTYQFHQMLETQFIEVEE